MNMRKIPRVACTAALLGLAGFLNPTLAADAAPAPAAPRPGVAAKVTKDGDYTISPPYANGLELTAVEGVPKGAIHEFTMNSADSKICPGLTGPYQRKVAVYVPSQYVAGTPVAFIVVHDGVGYANRLPVILDNLINDKRLPVMVAVMINSGGGDGKGSERGLEYDTVSDKFTTFVETEVLPRITRDYGVTFTKDPEGRATMGGSSGGSAAFTMGWFRPDLYRRILTYSGTYVNQQSPENPQSLHGAWEYHEHLIPQNPPKPLRIWLEVGQNDNGSTRDEASCHNWVLANQHMATVLKAKGYHYRYVYAEGAGHVDRRVVGQTLPEALLWLWQGYPIK